jgi:hypothetical protein
MQPFLALMVILVELGYRDNTLESKLISVDKNFSLLRLHISLLTIAEMRIRVNQGSELCCIST